MNIKFIPVGIVAALSIFSAPAIAGSAACSLFVGHAEAQATLAQNQAIDYVQALATKTDTWNAQQKFVKSEQFVLTSIEVAIDSCRKNSSLSDQYTIRRLINQSLQRIEEVRSIEKAALSSR